MCVVKMWLFIFFALVIGEYSVVSLRLINLNNLKRASDLFESLSSFNLSKITNHLTEIGRFMPNIVNCTLCYMNTAQLCEHYGYNSDSYTVTTTDGYVLTVFRCYKTITQIQPVLLVHGMMDSSDTWLISGTKSLAINYVDMGYDVYLINCRGNRYSREHQTLNPVDPIFWDFSWTEMAIYDVPETIEMIRSKTESSTIQCVGHSQGGTVLIALLSLKSEYNQIITHLGLLAPFTYMQEVGFPINVIIETFFYDDIINFEFVPYTFPQGLLSQTVCRVADGAICNMGLNFVLGPSYDQIDPDTFIQIFCHFPAGCSSKQLRHFGQEYHCKYFGTILKSPPPLCDKKLPSFDLNQVKTPISLFYSFNDPHTDPVDVSLFINNLANDDFEHTEISEFNHIDFVWGKNAAAYVYKPLILRAALFAR